MYSLMLEHNLEKIEAKVRFLVRSVFTYRKMRILKSNAYLRIINDSLVDSFINANISYMYNWGILLGVSFVVQILSGILCTFYYIGTIEDSFSSIEVLMREITGGSMIRYILGNNVSLIFICLYILIFKSLYYSSYIYRRLKLFITGVFLLLLSIVIAFLGYSLVCAIQSYWAIVVITNLLSSIRFIGGDLVILIWSNYSRSSLTIRRFFSLLYLLRFLLLGLIIALIIALLELAGTTLIGISGNIRMINFLANFTLKDIFRTMMYIWVLGYVIYYARTKLEDRENNIEFNRLVTRNAIVRLWYLLTYYAILRSISNKLLGVLTMILAILILMILRFNNTLLNRSNRFNRIIRVFLSLFVCSFVILLVLGAKHRSERFITLAQVCSIYYFSYIVFLLRILGIILNILIFS